MKKTIALLLSVLMLAALLVGCGSSGAGTTAAGTASGSASGSGAASGSAAAAKTLNFGLEAFSDGIINPMNQTNTAWNCMRYGVGECLFKFSDSMVPEPWLAESVSSNDDFTVWTITLRDGIKFSNGDALTATKVKESFDWTKTEGPNGTTSPQKYLPYEAEVVADDAARTVTITLPKADNNLPGKLAYPAMEIINVSATTDFDYYVIGTGPYMVQNAEPRVGYTMVKNPNYYEDVPYDTVNIVFLGLEAKASALQSGQVDLVENVSIPSNIALIQADPNLTYDSAPGVRTAFSWMNMSEGRPLSDKVLRQAILMAIDNETISASNTIGGMYKAGFSVLPSNLDFGYENLNNPYKYDLAAAKKLLTDNGYSYDGDKLMKDGQQVTLVYYSYDGRLLNEMTEAHQLYLEALGIKVDLKESTSGDCWDQMGAGNFDLCNNNWTTVGTGDPTEYMYNWYSKAGDAVNFSRYANPEYDKLYDEYTSNFDTAARKEIMQKMQQILVDDAVAIIDGYWSSSFAFNSKSVGEAHIHTADYYWLTNEIKPAA
ncbi:MAG: ABC transporter substrate-binding protein [Ruminococcaceae bacterium]|nr:ABC transporter substrate-binding protein [Oscillospiraceae bacterium]